MKEQDYLYYFHYGVYISLLLRGLMFHAMLYAVCFVLQLLQCYAFEEREKVSASSFVLPYPSHMGRKDYHRSNSVLIFSRLSFLTVISSISVSKSRKVSDVADAIREVNACRVERPWVMHIS